MTWAERIIGLRPAIVTGAWLLTTALGAIFMEAFPIGSMLAWIGFGLAAALGFSTILVWTHALCTVAQSRQSNTSASRQSAPFQSLIFWCSVWIAIVFLTVATQRYELFAVQAIATLIAGYFYLRAVWITTSALLAFEKSDNAFWTFVQILYFPIGVWFLQSRLQRLLSATPQAASSPA